jgi:hypothetical protein
MRSKLSMQAIPAAPESRPATALRGRAVSQLGSTITTVAAALQVHRLSHSSLAVGAVVAGGSACSVGVGPIGRFSPTLRGARLGAGTVTVLADAATPSLPNPANSLRRHGQLLARGGTVWVRTAAHPGRRRCLEGPP